MTPVLSLALLLSAAKGPGVEALFVRVEPGGGKVMRTPGQSRAVVLIHGLGLCMFHKERAVHAQPRSWQRPDSPLVRELSRLADVYAFAYGQTVPVERLGDEARLPLFLDALRSMGYREIVLVGHSAGGLIARHTVEDHPHLGVTRVIQVCAPNRGSPLAGLKAGCKEQLPFLLSMSLSARKRALAQRSEKRLPDGTEFICVVGACGLLGDRVVSESSQWSQDLQRQGVSAYRVRMSHIEAMRHPDLIALLAHLVRTSHPRSRLNR